MPKVGNYIQRDYHSRFSSKRKSRWKSYNQAWSQKRSNSLQKSQALKLQLSSSITNITVANGVQQARFFLQNAAAPQSTYASPTAVAARINVLV
ncbi:flagellar biosynthesis protein [Roseibium sp.]|uniref:flagellar biosynthesis protein n=1 Tax=Roseibium sp. TaxID=1936156 RepID=UPI003D0A7147